MLAWLCGSVFDEVACTTASSGVDCSLFSFRFFLCYQHKVQSKLNILNVWKYDNTFSPHILYFDVV